MRVGERLVTVGIVSGDYLAERPTREPLPAGFSQRQWLVTVVLAACAGLVILALARLVRAGGPFPLRGQHLFLALLLSGPILLCGPILLARRWPLPVLAVVAAAAGLAMATGNAPLPLSVMLGLAMYFVASRLPRRVSICVAAAAAAVLGGVLVYAAVAGRTALLPGDAVEAFLPLAAAWFIGDSVATRRRYQAGLAEQEERERAAEVERARQEVREERVRIARELHDVVAHTLTVITVQAGVGRRLMARRPEEAGAALESIEMIGRTAQDELRVVLGLLRDEQVGAASLAPAPRLVDLKELAENVQASGTPVRLRMAGTDRQLSRALELSVYRVVQEALTNVVKHAPGARATVDLAVSDNQVRIEVADDGGTAARSPGEDGRLASLGPGHGIVGMRERIGAFGGWLVAEPLADRGFQVLAEVPIE
jgi:signal transduction histidine kinase